MGRPTSTKESGERSRLFRHFGFLTNQLHFLQLPQEVGDVLKKLGPGQVKFLFERVCNFIHGASCLDHLPDLGSNRIQAETETLLDIQQYGTVLVNSFSYAPCNVDRGMVHGFWHADLLLKGVKEGSPDVLAILAQSGGFSTGRKAAHEGQVVFCGPRDCVDGTIESGMEWRQKMKCRRFADVRKYDAFRNREHGKCA
jgi:hypothetical protein